MFVESEITGIFLIFDKAHVTSAAFRLQNISWVISDTEMAENNGI